MDLGCPLLRGPSDRRLRRRAATEKTKKTIVEYGYFEQYRGERRLADVIEIQTETHFGYINHIVRYIPAVKNTWIFYSTTRIGNTIQRHIHIVTISNKKKLML